MGKTLFEKIWDEHVVVEKANSPSLIYVDRHLVHEVTSPHMAMMLGAQQSKTQLLVASLVGASLMLWADWLGQVIVYPMQIAAGTLVAILGGSYFLLLLLVNRSK